jgi:hypothetical protein
LPSANRLRPAALTLGVFPVPAAHFAFRTDIQFGRLPRIKEKGRKFSAALSQRARMPISVKECEGEEVHSL